MDQPMTIELNGPWTLRFADGERGGVLERMFAVDADLRNAIPAVVPGEVHLDLLRAGLIAEPNEGLNALSARWVEETRWHYRRTFEAPALKEGQRASLCLDGVQLAAVVYLNGHEVGRHANAFYPCRLDVTERLHEGVNTLVVDLESGLFWASEKPTAGYGTGFGVGLHRRIWLRQTQSEAAWDWSPRLLNVGLTGAARLQICTGPRCDQISVATSLQDDLKTATVRARAVLDAADPGDVTLTVELPELDLTATAACALVAGQQRVEVSVPVREPELWWPVGHGAARRYEVVVTVRAGDVELAHETRQVGFRHVRVNQDADGVGGRLFRFEVNGRPVFAKGGNVVPADLIPARLSRERYATLVDRAVESNFNFLRIWGGGLYESDDFYDACDERGILVWQEFIFACAKYPAHDPDFVASVKNEATYQVRRLAHHPSLVTWCGNNEIEWGYWTWNYEQGVSRPDHALYHLVLPLIVNDEDGTRFYQPSSPYSPELRDPNDDTMGDQHPWSVGMADTDFRKYRNMACRFPNEGGILGPNSLPTMRACLPPGHQGHGSFAWEQHDNSVAYWGLTSYPDEMIRQWLGLDPREMTLEQYCYWCGLVHGEGLREYIENFHRRWPLTSSAIYWMYNDVWPTVRSWTTVDHYLRRTPAFWPVKRAMEPVNVVVTHDGANLRWFGVNETSEPIASSLFYGLIALDGREHGARWADEVVLQPYCSTELVPAMADDQWSEYGLTPSAACGYGVLYREGQPALRSRCFLPLFKEVDWPEPRLQVRLENGTAVFSSETFVWGVCLGLDGETPLADNFFDVWPGYEHRIDWLCEQAPRVLATGNRLNYELKP